jgi:transcriptional regulator with XRE-family HTH domain
MEEPGQKLKRARERLSLRYRDVNEASQKLADLYKNREFYIALSRLSDIENRGVVPSIFRLYSLCSIYRLDFLDVMNWYGVNVGNVPSDAARIPISQTHVLEMNAPPTGIVQLPVLADANLDLKKTFFLNRHVREWGILPLHMLNSADFRKNKYGFIGSDDWTMYPILMPGSLVQIDDSRTKIATSGWIYEHERPIYFLEHRNGFECCWCSLLGNQLILQPHGSSPVAGKQFRYPGEVEVIGQVIAVAMRLDQGKRRRTRS